MNYKENRISKQFGQRCIIRYLHQKQEISDRDYDVLRWYKRWSALDDNDVGRLPSRRFDCIDTPVQNRQNYIQDYQQSLRLFRKIRRHVQEQLYLDRKETYFQVFEAILAYDRETRSAVANYKKLGHQDKLNVIKCFKAMSQLVNDCQNKGDKAVSYGEFANLNKSYETPEATDG